MQWGAKQDRQKVRTIARSAKFYTDDNMPEQLLTLEEVAEYLNIDRFTVYRLLAQKKIPGFKVGSQWRFKRQMIETWLMKNVTGSRKLPH